MVTAGDDGAGVGSGTGDSRLRGGQAATLQAGCQWHDAVVAALRHLGGLCSNAVSDRGGAEEKGECRRSTSDDAGDG